jgi:hypothetical protein
VPIFPPPPTMPSASGLPSYTIPTSGAASANRGAAEDSDHPYRSSQSSWGRPAAEQPDADPAWGTPGGPVWDHPGAAPAPSGPSWNAPSGPHSPGGPHSAGGFRPAPAAQVSTPPAPAGTYGGGVPQQRGEGTVYGGVGNQSPIDMTMPVSMNPAVENSGSLTGHILAQGWDFGADTGRRSNMKVGIAMLVVLLVLVGVSVLFLFTAGEAFTDMLNGVLGKE